LLFVDCDKQRASRLGLYMATLYAGNALGQLLIEYLGTSGSLPFLSIITLLSFAILAPLFSQNSAPQQTQHQALSLKTLSSLSKPAVIGCLVSGLVLGPIYGLMPAYLSSNALWSDNIGKLMATLILGGMLIQPICSYLSARFNKTLLQALISALGLLAAISIVMVETALGLSLCLFALGAAAFALYPIAICQACHKANASSIVAITELMLLSYSIGSVVGPLIAGLNDQSSEALPMYLAGIFVSTSVYMLLMASKNITLPEPV
jgi:MFS family permease